MIFHSLCLFFFFVSIFVSQFMLILFFINETKMIGWMKTCLDYNMLLFDDWGALAPVVGWSSRVQSTAPPVHMLKCP